MADPRILTVCTANICRSPATAVLLQRGLATLYPTASISSAGTEALPGNPACDLSSALVGEYVATHYPTVAASLPLNGHRSHRVTVGDLGRAELILALDRDHRSALARLHPGSRTRTFTLRQAAAAAGRVEESLLAGELPPGAPPLPGDGHDRFLWWVGELDAARAYLATDPAPPKLPMPVDPLDVPDPHVFGYQYHPMAVELIESAVARLVASLQTLARFGATAN